MQKRKIRISLENDFLALMMKEFFGKEYDLKIFKNGGASNQNYDLVLIWDWTAALRRTKTERIIYLMSFYFFDPVDYDKTLEKLANKKTVVFYWENLYKKSTINWFLNLLLFKLKLLKHFPLFFHEKLSKILEIKISSPHKQELKTIERHPGNFVITNKHKKLTAMPLFINRLYRPIRKRGGMEKRKKFCAFVCSNSTSAERNYFFKKLSRYKKVDSFGKVMKNAEYPEKTKEADHYILNRDLFKKYKFVICFENSFEEDYITEKILQPMIAGAVPIYRGAPNISEYFNTRSFINYDDCGSYEKMMEKVIELDRDDKKYNDFLKQPWMNGKNFKKVEDRKKDLKKFLKNIIES